MLVEDDHSISKMVTDRLSKEGYEVTPVYDGEEALKVLEEEKDFDLILLDLMLPKINGIECLRVIRMNSLVPVLIMSAKDEDVDKALGLGFGADDYITKPFSLIELTARIQALIRRSTHYVTKPIHKKNTMMKVGDLVLDLDGYSVKKNDKVVKLTATEFNILKLFITKPTHVYTKSQLYNLVWQEDYMQDMNVINVHIRRLREKIEDNPSDPKYIKTLWGIGYRLGEF